MQVVSRLRVPEGDGIGPAYGVEEVILPNRAFLLGGIAPVSGKRKRTVSTGVEWAARTSA